VLGVDPLAPTWAGRSAGEDPALRRATDALVRALLEQRELARANKDFDAADRIRDQLKEAGIDVEDTPSGPRWTVVS
jgi:cysteinyl-tRNA synthetase